MASWGRLVSAPASKSRLEGTTLSLKAQVKIGRRRPHNVRITAGVPNGECGESACSIPTRRKGLRMTRLLSPWLWEPNLNPYGLGGRGIVHRGGSSSQRIRSVSP